LRDARHLLIMAPIQQKTCEQLVNAAVKTQEKLRALRIEWWKLTCHQDILALDLEEEERDTERWQVRIDQLSPQPAASSGDSEVGPNLSRAPSGASMSSAATAARDPASINIYKHTPKPSEDSDAPTATGESATFHTPPETTPSQITPPHTPTVSAHSPQGSTISPQASPGPYGHRMSALSAYSHTSHLQPRGPRPSLDIPPGSPNKPESVTAASDDEDDEVAVTDANIPLRPIKDEGRPKTPSSLENGRDEQEDRRPGSSAGGTPERGRVRRVSIQRVLKEPYEHRGHARHSSRKVGSKDMKDSDASVNSDGSPQSAGPSLHSALSHRSKLDKKSEEGNTGLVRERPSFTVHGKKASIVTIGGDWTVNPEETLQRMKAAASPVTPGAASKEKDVSASSVKSPLSRMTTADEDEAHQKDKNATPRAGSPAPSNGEAAPPPRTSSLRSKERKPPSIRSHSSAALSSKTVDTTIEDGAQKPSREAKVEA